MLTLRKSIRALSAVALFAAGAIQAQPLKPAPAKTSSLPNSTPVITVGAKTIRKGQIDTLVAYMAKSRGADISTLKPEQVAQLRQLVSTNLIGQELLELEAKAKKLQATPHESDSAFRVLQGQFPDAATFQKAMQQSGETPARIKEKIARQIRADKVLAANIKQPALPTDADMRAFWEQHQKDFPINDSLRAVQILFKVDDKTSTETAADKKRRLEAIRRDLAVDSDQTPVLLRRFMAEAARVSEGPEAEMGGDLQRFYPGDFNLDFRKQVTSLRVGQLSPVFKSPLGYHLVLLIEKYDGKYESYRLQSMQNLMAEKNAEMGTQMRQFLKKLAVKFPVKYLKPDYRDQSESGIY